jgi:hypothetical protein
MDTQVRKFFVIVFGGLLFCFLLFLVLFSSGTPDQKDLKKIFINAKGEKAAALLSEDNENVTLNFPEAQMTDVVLKKEVSPRGFQYVNDTYVLIGEGKRITIKADGNIVFQGKEARKGR